MAEVRKVSRVERMRMRNERVATLYERRTTQYKELKDAANRLLSALDEHPPRVIDPLVTTQARALAKLTEFSVQAEYEHRERIDEDIAKMLHREFAGPNGVGFLTQEDADANWVALKVSADGRTVIMHWRALAKKVREFVYGVKEEDHG